jgi:type II secretory pathway component PulF
MKKKSEFKKFKVITVNKDGAVQKDSIYARSEEEIREKMSGQSAVGIEEEE